MFSQFSINGALTLFMNIRYKLNLICMFLGVRKTLVTGSVPTENLPEKSHKARKRRPLVRKAHTSADTAVVEKPSTSSQSEPQFSDIQDFTRQLEQKRIQPWQIEKSYEGEIRIELHDKIHSIPKYTVVVCLCLEFTVFVFNWPVPDHHPIYKEHKHSIKYLDIDELLQRIENSRLCEGLKEDEDIMSVATDPTGNSDPNPSPLFAILCAKLSKSKSLTLK